MDNLQIFNFGPTKVRIVSINDQPWFVAADVCRCLGIGEPHVAYRRLHSDEISYRCRTTVGMKPGRPMAFISGSGLYELIMRSDKPEARRFQDWVTREVLPKT